MSTAQEQIQSCIDMHSLPGIVTMMVILAFWILKRISPEECAGFALQLGYSFDTETHEVSKNAETYSVLQILTMACTDVYPAKVELGKFVMRTVLKSAKDENYITAENYTGLVALL